MVFRFKKCKICNLDLAGEGKDGDLCWTCDAERRHWMIQKSIQNKELKEMFKDISRHYFELIGERSRNETQILILKKKEERRKHVITRLFEQIYASDFGSVARWLYDEIMSLVPELKEKLDKEREIENGKNM